MRVDKWLWAARFYKTRSTATEAVLGGRVHVNGARAKPAKEIKPGDEIEVTLGIVRRVVEVLALCDKRGPANVAATLYRETADSIEARERVAAERRLAAPPRSDLAGRPTKLDRRRIEALRRGQRRA